MNYQKAVRYATKLIKDYSAPYNPRDLVHDSYIQWWKYQNTCLFEASEGAIMKTIKNFHFNNLNKQYYHKGSAKDLKEGRGEKIKKVNFIINTDGGSEDYKDEHYEDSSNRNFDKQFTPVETKTPETILISKQNIQNLNDILCDFDRKVLDLKVKGYQNGEIEDILNTHNVKITKSIKNIKDTMYTKSPFNGSRLKIIKKIKRKEFDANKEKYLSEFEMGEDSDFNDFYIQMTSKNNPEEGLLIKEKDSD